MGKVVSRLLFHVKVRKERKTIKKIIMGRHIKNTQILNWMTSRVSVLRRTETLNRAAIMKTITKIISFITPLQLAMTNVEFHSGPNQVLKIIISGTKSSELNEIKKVLETILASISFGFAPKCEILIQEISSDSLKFDPIILAKAIASDRNHRKILGSHIWSHFVGASSSLTQSNITGIRIEIKGIAGKMTMSKKIIKTFGTLKFNSSSSIINFGEARSIGNQRGIIGVKVWIAYNQNV